MGAYLGIFITLFSSIMLDSIVATVDDESLTYSDIIREGELLNIENGQPAETPLTPALKKKILELIIMRYLLRKEAVSQEITIPLHQLNKKIKIYHGNPQMAAFLKRWSLSKIDFRSILHLRMLGDEVTTHYKKRVSKGKKISDAEKSEAMLEWIKKLKKRWKITTYPIP